MFRSSLLWQQVLEQRAVPQMARAFAHFSKRLLEGIETLDGIDYSSVQDELDLLNQVEDDLADSDCERADQLACDLWCFSGAVDDIHDSYFGLAALSFLNSGQDRDAILNKLGDKTWLEKMEVLARWGWMKEHQDLLKKGDEIEYPFLCRVPPRNKRQNVDREFDTFLRFSHGLKIYTGEELLFVRKRESPDFAVETDKGEIIGVEVGEAPLSQDWADDQDAMRTVHDALSRIVCDAGLNLVLFDSPPGRFWLERLNRLEACVSRAIEEAARQGAMTLRDEELRLDAELKPANSKPGIFSMSRRGEIHEDFRRQEEAVAGAIAEGLRKKLERTERNGRSRPRKKPEIRPCYLALYPNMDFGLEDRARTVDLARESLRASNVDPKSHFDQVWLTAEDFIHQVL